MKQPRLTYLFLTFLLALLSASCKKDSLPAPVAEEEESGSGVYVSVVVNTEGGNSSRADGATDDYNPTGGENGDGNQAGEGEENMVHDLTLFFLNKTLNEATEICASAYFDEKDITPAASGSITRYTVQREIEGLFVGNKYYVVAIVNAGDLTNKITRIDELKDYQFSEVIVTHGSERWFLMASEKDSEEIEIRANNSQYNPTWVNVYVERMTARVDCAWVNPYKIMGNDMPSEGGGSYYGKDQVKTLGASLVNRYINDTYAFKRVTESTSSLTTVQYLGDELPSPSSGGAAGNYVLDPLTAIGKSNTDFDYYYPEYNHWDTASDFYDVYTNLSFSSTHNSQMYYRLDYVRENINTVRQLRIGGIDHYATGVMYKARYIPDGYKEGETFYVYPQSYGRYSIRTVFSADELRQEFPNIFGDTPESTWVDQVKDLEKYTNGECYYVYWIRHADDDDNNRISAMEYAIVRNNIYQLYVNSIEGLGSPEPDSHIEEFEEEIHLHVKNWEKVEVEVPPFD